VERFRNIDEYAKYVELKVEETSLHDYEKMAVKSRVRSLLINRNVTSLYELIKLLHMLKLYELIPSANEIENWMIKGYIFRG